MSPIPLSPKRLPYRMPRDRYLHKRGLLLGVCPFINAFFPSIEFWNPPQALLLVAAGGDIVTRLAIFTFGLLTIKEPFRWAYLKSIAALALLGVVFDLLGGLYALSAQLGLYASLTLLRKEADEGDLL